MTQTYKAQHLNLDFITEFLTIEESDNIFNECQKIKFPSETRRSSVTFGDTGLIYTIEFKNDIIHRIAKEWINPLLIIKEKLEKITNIVYNSCAILKYPNGNINI